MIEILKKKLDFRKYKKPSVFFSHKVREFKIIAFDDFNKKIEPKK
jgi:hypothetical protein